MLRADKTSACFRAKRREALGKPLSQSDKSLHNATKGYCFYETLNYNDLIYNYSIFPARFALPVC